MRRPLRAQSPRAAYASVWGVCARSAGRGCTARAQSPPPAEAVAARGVEATGARRMPGGGAGWSGAGHPPDAKGVPAGRQSAGGQRAGPGPAETGVAATRPTRHARVAACPRLWQTLLVQHFRIHESGSLPRQCWELRPRARILAAGSRTPHPKLTTHAFTYVSARATRPSAGVGMTQVVIDTKTVVRQRELSKPSIQ